jgi:hypothetical protein
MEAAMTRIPLLARQVLALAGLLAAASGAGAQTSADLQQAQQAFEKQLAACNSGQLPAPQREACVRDAGAALDQARAATGNAGSAGNVTSRTADGRATVVTPAGAPVPGGGSDTVRSSDRRSTVVLPADPGSRP